MLNTAICSAQAPSWWTNRNVLTTNTVNDYAAVNAGQVKWIATNLYLEMTNTYWGPGTNLLNLVGNFYSTNDYTAVNVGQLKYITKTFYDRLIELGYKREYPWTADTSDDNDYAIVNVGMVKNIFCIDITKDADGDGMHDLWEIGYFESTNQNASGDFDGDGLTNLAEFVKGTSPDGSDFDNDGMGDGVEVQLGYDPTISNSFTFLPFSELFETNTVTTGDISNQNGWVASPTNSAIVQTGTVHAGSQALELVASTNVADCYHLIAAADEDFIWSDFYVQPARRTSTNPPSISETASAAFYVNSNGYLTVYDGTNGWTTLTNYTALPTNAFSRITVRGNYANKKWDLWLNTTNIATDLGFANQIAEYYRARFTGDEQQSTFIDNLQISSSYTSLEYSVSGIVSYGGEQTGTIHVIAVTVSDSWSLYSNTNLSSTGAYSIVNLPGLEHYYIKAFRDMDNDQKRDSWEAQTTYTSNPLYVTSNVSGINMTMQDPDDDSDGIDDWWEMKYFGDLDETPSDDPDGDGLTNQEEYSTWNTDPSSTDSDGDGLEDGEEVELGTDPANSDSHLADVSGTVSYSGIQTGYIKVLAVTASNSWALAYSDEISASGSYIITNLVNLTNQWIKAYRDSNSNETNEYWEASGAYTSNPAYFTNDLSGINITLANPTNDNDADSMQDWWEMHYFGNLSQTATNDFDGDGLSNWQEYTNAASGYNPVIADTDGDGILDGDDASPVSSVDSDSDGMPDDWETHWFGSITNSAGTNNYDGDALTDLEEYLGITDPTLINTNDTGNIMELLIFTPVETDEE